MSDPYTVSSKSSRLRNIQIMERTKSALTQLLQFKTIYDIQNYLTDRHTRDWREFEAATADEVFDGAGVIATRENVLLDPDQDGGSYLHTDVPMGSHETGAYINGFPLNAASASYVFTLLEAFGDEIAELMQPGSLNRNRAWHEDIKGFVDIRDPVQVKKAREAFVKHFGADPDDLPEQAALRMIALKKIRNDFAHAGGSAVNLPRYLASTIAVVCHIAFLASDEELISVYPWEDHENRFKLRPA